MKRLNCIQCGHVWQARSERMPQQCPKCKSLKWNDAAIMTRAELIAEINAEYAITYSDYIQAALKPSKGVDYYFVKALTCKSELIRLEYRFKSILSSDAMPAYLIAEIIAALTAKGE